VELASDRYEGRETASQGYHRAAEFVAAEFKNLGLAGVGKEGYLQPVPLVVRKLRPAESSLSLTRSGLQEMLELGSDATIGTHTGPPAEFEAPAVFAGYGLTVPERNYDDLAGLDLKGRVVVCLSGGPPSIPASMRAHYQALHQRQVFLKRAGAVGLAIISNPVNMEQPWERMAATRMAASMTLAEPGLIDGRDLRLSVTINPDRADKWFDGTGYTLNRILEQAKAGGPLPKFPLAWNVRAIVSADTYNTECFNIAAILRGRDRNLRQEYVVVSAHLDHLGSGVPIAGDSIYNGAMDNAAGVASLIEVARALRAATPRRSVLFLATTGEEKGLLGSRHFAADSGLAPGSIVAGINLDMCLPIHALRLLKALGLEESSLANDVRTAARAYGLRVQTDPHPERNSLIRSDQYSFILRGVPSLAFGFGAITGSAEENAQNAWLKQRYHAPSDDSTQPVNLAAAARFNRLMADILRRVANRPARPSWNQDSFFGSLAAAGE
jgi:hypothetical protein